MKILVTYATRVGSTAETAVEIGRVIANGDGCQVDVCPVKDVTDLTPYQAIVVGSGIRGGRWLPEAVEFVEAHREALRQVPVAYFLVCLTLREDTEENRREAAAYLDPVREIVQPAAVGLFAGVMDYGRLSFPLRLMMRAMKAPQGDFRDWEAIRAWAAQVRDRIGAGR